MKAVLIVVLLSGFLSTLKAQEPTSSSALQSGFLKQETIINSSLFKNLHPRSVGPVAMSGRVTDFAVTKNPKKYYVAFASGGVFVTQNYGTSFEPIFDHIHALGIGDIALSELDENHIWVGTGEKNSSRSSYAGSGVYKSTDGGKTWQLTGLSNSQHIGRIVIHPTDVNTVWVASIGPLYSYGGERGVYKTTDGGKTWNRTLFINDSTGVIDLVMEPENPSVLYAATWQRYRQAWNFDGSGNGSGIWKSTDAGETWSKLTTGLPSGKFVGRIGLDISPKAPERIYAIIDNLEETKTAVEKEKGVLYIDDFVSMSKETFLQLDEKQLNTFLRSNGFPGKYTAESVKKAVKDGEFPVKALSNYTGNANDALFNTKVAGAEVYRSDDAGKTWKKANSYELDGVYFTYGYYFGEIRVTPSNPDEMYVLGVPLLRSQDGGKTWKRVDHSGVHVDHQALWINPSDPEHLLLGNDGGIYSSFDAAKTWTHHNSLPVGQFYTVMVDNAKPYNIYGGLQDNGVYFGSSTSVPGKSDFWKPIMGGDGMHVAVHPTHNALVYTGFQFGNYYRLDVSTNQRTYITPKHDIGKDAYRFNWKTPLKISFHNPDVVYIGAQKLLRSMNRGDSFDEISPDLTTNVQPQGNVPYSTISTFSESVLQFGWIWVGTDDGKVHLTENGGATWSDITKGLPKNMWVSSILASPHDKNTAFVTLTGYRYDHFAPYVYKTTDRGKTWTSLSEGLPYQPVNTIVQDPKFPELLFVGTDFGAYFSIDYGKTWQGLSNKLPNVAVYDMIIQERENELVLATHGRSIFVLELNPIREMMKKGFETPIHLFEIEPITHSSRWGEKRNAYTEPFLPTLTFSYYASKAGEIQLSIFEKDGKKPITSWKINAESGYNTSDWNLILNTTKDGKSVFIKPGDYEMVAKIGKSESKTKVTVKQRN